MKAKRKQAAPSLLSLGPEQVQLPGQLHEIPVQGPVADVDAPYPGHNDQVPSREKLLLVEAVDLPQAAADPVPGDGIAQLLADRNAQPVAALPVFLNVEDQGGQTARLPRL